MLTLKVPIILIIDILQENKSLLEMHMYTICGVELLIQLSDAPNE